MKPRLSRLIALFLFVAPCWVARSQAPASPPVEPIVSVQFILYAWQSGLPALRYSAKDTTEALPDPFSTSAVHTYTGPATLTFYSATARPTSDTAPPPPLATVTFPVGPRKFMLLAGRADAGRISIYAVPQDDTSIPTPYIRVHNFTQLTLAVGYNERDVAQVDPSSTVIIKPAGSATVIRVAQLQNGKWRRVFNNVAEVGRDGRQNIILAPAAARPVSLYTIPAWPQDTSAAHTPASDS